MSLSLPSNTFGTKKCTRAHLTTRVLQHGALSHHTHSSKGLTEVSTVGEPTLTYVMPMVVNKLKALVVLHLKP